MRAGVKGCEHNDGGELAAAKQMTRVPGSGQMVLGTGAQKMIGSGGVRADKLVMDCPPQ